jgi:CHAP domain
MNTISRTQVPQLATLALQAAQSQIGQSEQPIGSNSGHMVNEYLKAAGLPPGYPWCQAFVYWCYGSAAQKAGRTNPMIHTASVHDCWDRAVNSQHITKYTREDVQANPSLLKPGMQFILALSPGEGHTGIIEQVEPLVIPHINTAGLLLHTIEGNSNTNGSREGYEVVRHTRNIADKVLVGFIEYL